MRKMIEEIAEVLAEEVEESDIRPLSLAIRKRKQREKFQLEECGKEDSGTD
jgi:hypothetical protein